MATIKGTSGNDNLFGTPKSDRLLGNLGNDTLTGSAGPDKFVFNNIIDVAQLNLDLFVYSPDGFDIIKDFNGFEKDSIINVNFGKSYPYNISITGIGSAAATAADSEETKYIFGTKGSDKINGTAVDDNINSLSGNDKLYGNDGNDKLYGCTGDDSLYGGAGSDNLYGAVRVTTI
jgi:Ca2+-binding RTX toxin-like protein